MIETTEQPIDDPKHPYGTLPHCNEVHAKYGPCIRWSQHPGGHQWQNAPRPWWLIWLYLALACLAAWWITTNIARGQTQVTPRQMRGLASVVVMKCAGVTATTVDPPTVSDCTGLYLVDLVAADGTELKIIGAPAAPGVKIDPTQWSVIP